MSVLSEVSSRAAVVCGRTVERATGTTLVRISGFILIVRELGDRPVRTRGDTVSETTAITELVVVEALKMSNSVCKAIGEPPLDMPGKEGKQKSREVFTES